ncbi:nucleotide sugar dehydrogenase [Streptomyces sp. NPDC058953]|uniref:nucleotide sugar dehydrogenase n=1 Tax=unclassified Streptomyces TaxID=2593676 RepID=UPI0036B02417
MTDSTDGGGRGGRPVVVVGLGYVGLPLAASLAAAGVDVIGVDTNPETRRTVTEGRAPFYEPGLTELLQGLPPGRLTVSDRIPGQAPRAAVICVGTPMSPETGHPALGHLESAADAVAEAMADDTLVVVRSTVPVGTCRETVLPRLRKQVAEPLLAFCPERLIQGKALAELVSLPQIIGGLDEPSRERARELHALITPNHVPVSSLETAEMIKLICNAHTDLLYGFGNEISMMAACFGLDANEVIASANLDYPRPDLARPGFVGGSCLTKDPYLLTYGTRAHGYDAPMVTAARRVNESVPAFAVESFTKAYAARTAKPLSEAKILVCGIAYKGRPETDDVRGAASPDVAKALRGKVATLAAHDFLVPRDAVEALGFEPTSLEDGLRDADGIIVLNDHPGYAEITADAVRSRMRAPRVVFDMWGTLEAALAHDSDITYLRLGRV